MTSQISDPSQRVEAANELGNACQDALHRHSLIDEERLKQLSNAVKQLHEVGKNIGFLGANLKRAEAESDDLVELARRIEDQALIMEAPLNAHYEITQLRQEVANAKYEVIRAKLGIFVDKTG